MSQDTKSATELLKNAPLNVTTEQAIVGAVIAKLREARGMTQKDVVEKMETSESAWSRVEKGDTSLSVVEFNRLTKILGISSDEILKLVDESKVALIAKGVDVKSTGAAKDWKGSSVAGGLTSTGMLPVYGTLLFGLVGGVIGAGISVYKTLTDEQDKGK